MRLRIFAAFLVLAFFAQLTVIHAAGSEQPSLGASGDARQQAASKGCDGKGKQKGPKKGQKGGRKAGQGQQQTSPGE